MIIRRFLKSKNMVIRFGAHEAQRAPQEMEDEAREFVERVRPLLSSSKRGQKIHIKYGSNSGVLFYDTDNHLN